MHKRLFCVIGPSASGKTSFSIQLAKKLQSSGKDVVILCVDVMQMYAGLPIATNKPTAAEKEGIKHEYIGFLDPFAMQDDSENDGCDANAYDNPHNIAEFVPNIVNRIHSLQEEGVIVILTGGTLYYVQAILTDSLLTSEEESDFVKARKAEIRAMSPEILYSELKRVDLLMAQRWHPNDYRHVRRSLEVFYESGESQSTQMKANSQKVALRWPDHAIFWIDCSMHWLHNRIETRITQMESNGLCAEVTEFYLRDCAYRGQSNAFEKAIGFKEFFPYLNWIQGARERALGNLTEKNGTRRCVKSAQRTHVLWKQCLAELVQKTKQYCTKQVRWIRKKILPESDFIVFRVATWKGADELLFLQDKEIEDIAVMTLDSLQSHPRRVFTEKPMKEKRIVHFCHLCEKHLESAAQIEAHNASRLHRKAVHRSMKAV